MRRSREHCSLQHFKNRSSFFFLEVLVSRLGKVDVFHCLVDLGEFSFLIDFLRQFFSLQIHFERFCGLVSPDASSFPEAAWPRYFSCIDKFKASTSPPLTYSPFFPKALAIYCIFSCPNSHSPRQKWCSTALLSVILRGQVPQHQGSVNTHRWEK